MNSGYDLKCTISNNCNINSDRLKVICSGHVIEDLKPLHLQNVKVCLAQQKLVFNEWQWYLFSSFIVFYV